MKVVQFERCGPAHEVCECVEVAEPQAPGEGEIVIELEVCPIVPADLSMIAGTYPGVTGFPMRPGIEGLGRVKAVGAGSAPIKVGDRVVSLGRSNWAQRLKLTSKEVLHVPNDADPFQMAMLKANPATAWMMLDKFQHQLSGGWLIQNAANSSFGRFLVTLAKQRGLRTVNIVRHPHIAKSLEAGGADVVLVDGPDIAQRVSDATGGAAISIGFDAVGGAATDRLAASLAEGGTVVNFGFLSGEPCQLSTGQTIVRDIRLQGYWTLREMPALDRHKIEEMYARLTEMLSDESLAAPIAAAYPLEDVKTALTHAARSGRTGKVVLIPNGLPKRH